MAIPEGLLSYLWVAATAVLVPTVFGLGLVRGLGLAAHEGHRVHIAFAWLVGQFATAALTAGWLASGKPIPGPMLVGVALVIGLFGLFAFRNRGADAAAVTALVSRNRLDWLVGAATAVVVAVLVLECLAANADPIRLGDEADIWAAKAKAFYAAPGLDLQLGLSMVQAADYPNLSPLLQVFAFAGSGRVLHFESRLPVQCFGIALLLLLSAACQRRAHPLLAMAAVVACSATLGTANVTRLYADTALAFATLATVEALLRWREGGGAAWWRLACCGAAAMLATKNEGAMLLLVVFAATAGWCWFARAAEQPRVRAADVAWLGLPMATYALHQDFLPAFAVRNAMLDASTAGGRGMFTRIVDQASTHAGPVLAWFGKMAIDPVPHRLLPLLFVVAVTAALATGGRRSLREPAALLFAIVFGGIGGYMLVFVGAQEPLDWRLPTAAARTVQHLVPLAALGVAMTIWPRRSTPTAA